jgi:hypothetical protein
MPFASLTRQRNSGTTEEEEEEKEEDVKLQAIIRTTLVHCHLVYYK